MEVCIGPSHIVLDGDPAAPPPKKRGGGTAPQFRPMPVVAERSSVDIARRYSEDIARQRCAMVPRWRFFMAALYVIGQPLYFCPVVSIFFLFFLA